MPLRVAAYPLNSSLAYTAFLEYLGGVLERIGGWEEWPAARGEYLVWGAQNCFIALCR